MRMCWTLIVMLAACGSPGGDDDDDVGSSSSSVLSLCEEADDAYAAAGCSDGDPDFCPSEARLAEKSGCEAEVEAWFQCLIDAADVGLACMDDCDPSPSVECESIYCMDHYPSDPDCFGPPPMP